MLCHVVSCYVMLGEVRRGWVGLLCVGLGQALLGKDCLGEVGLG